MTPNPAFQQAGKSRVFTDLRISTLGFMNDTLSKLEISAWSWWAARRMRYNAILLISATVSFICLLMIWWLFESRLPCLEITGFSLAFGGLLFVVGLGLSNLCFYLGPIFEHLLRPTDMYAYRRRAFRLGTGFSLMLIFLPVIGNLVAAAHGPAPGGQCG